MKLLICIAFHDAPERLCYLKMIVMRFLNEYRLFFDHVQIIIDTNRIDSLIQEETLAPAIADGRIRIVAQTSLDHPFHLTWCHRQHIKELIDDYDVFMYVEDDIDIPLANMKRYLENFELLEGKGVPVFLRVEMKDDERYNTDTEHIQHLPASNVKMIGDRRFITELRHPLPYHAFWICPQKQLKEWMPSDFVKFSISRETAASFMIWELRKPHYLEIQPDQDLVAETSLAFHLPNNYACSNSHFGSILLKHVFVLDG